ncbi:MAG: PTS IIA-like nitrogen regulatory protein PtsN [Pseudomonadota bacterium]
MNLILPLLPPTHILLDVEVSSKKRLFEQVAELFEARIALSHDTVFDSLLTREKLGSTALGHGIAIPHGRIKGLKQASGALLRMHTPVEFDAPDDLPVTILFTLLVPAQATDQHLQILGELAQMFSDKPLREALMTAPDAASVHALIAAWSA